MKKNLIETLTEIRNLSDFEGAAPTIGELTAVMKSINSLATKALPEKTDRRGEKVQEIKTFIMNEGIMFQTAEEITEALNAAGLKTVRNVEWTTATTTAILGDVRELISAELKAAAAKKAPLPEPVDDRPVGREGEVVEPKIATAAVAAPAVPEAPEPLKPEVLDGLLEELEDLNLGVAR